MTTPPAAARWSLRSKAAVVLTVMSLLPLIAVGTWAQRLVQKAVVSSVLELHTKVAERLAAEVSSYLEAMGGRMRLGIAAAEVVRSDWKGIETLLRSLAVSHPDIRAVAIISRKGKALLKIEAGAPLADTGSLEPCRRGADPVCWLPPSGRNPSLLELRQPMASGLSMRLTVVPNSLVDALGSGRIGGTGFAFLVDREGLPLFFPDPLPQDRRGEVRGWPIARQALAAGAVGSSMFQDGAGRRQIGAYAPVPAFQGAVLTIQPEAEAFWAANQMRRSLLLAVSLVAVLALAAAFWLSLRLSRPLLLLSQAAQQVAAGSFPETPSIRTGDELQTLSETFRLMVGELRKYSEVQLDRVLEARRRMEAMLYSIEDGILMTDGSGRLVLANRSAGEMTGLPAGEAVEGRRPEDLPLPPEVRAALAAALADPSGPSRELTFGAAGAARTLRIAARPVVLPKGQDLRGVVLALRDVTLERELERMKDDFLHSITHDLRGPITSIMGFSSYLLKGVGGTLGAEQNEMVSTIKDASGRVLALVNNILDLARMQSHKLKVNPSLVDLREVAEQTARTLRGLAQQRGVTLTVAPGALPPVEADPQLVERLLANLVGNAAKFARENGAVTVSGRDAGASVEVCVADDGEGIPAAYREKIFEKFEQVPGTRQGGMGLGLTICRQIVQLHGGRLWLESEEGRGARFFFSLPKRFSPPHPAPGAPQEASA